MKFDFQVRKGHAGKRTVLEGALYLRGNVRFHEDTSRVLIKGMHLICYIVVQNSQGQKWKK